MAVQSRRQSAGTSRRALGRGAVKAKPRAVLPRPLVELDGVSKSFGRRPVLRGLSFSASAGELVVVTGVSGAGKTTLLRLLHGQVRPDRGQVWVDGRPLHRRWFRGVEALRRDSGFVFQDHRLLPRLTAFENVAFALQVAHPDVPSAVIRRAAQEALAAVGLEEMARRLPVELSTGERQRVAVARALAGAPRLVLADEPTASLDDASADLVWDALRRAAEGGALVVATTPRLQVATRMISLPRLAPEPKPKTKSRSVPWRR